MGDQDPQYLRCFGDADHQPAQGNLDEPDLTSVSERHLKWGLQRYCGCQVIQQLFLPAVQALIVDLDPAIVAGSDDEFPFHSLHLVENLLVIQSCISYET